MDTKKLAEMDRGILSMLRLREDIIQCCRTLHILGQRIERGDVNSIEELAAYYHHIIETHAQLGSKLKQFGVFSGSIQVTPVDKNNGKVLVKSSMEDS